VEALLANVGATMRPYKQSDAKALAGLADNPNVCHYLANRFPSPYTLEDATQWVARFGHEREQHIFAIEWQGQLVGGIGLDPMADIHSLTAGVGYWVGEPFWGNGIATEALGLMVGHAFGELPYLRLQAMVFAENKNSARVLEKNGFVLEGTLRRHITKHGRVYDALLYARTR
jgi:RimJ/RimL family protein N-acetyltransferase